jgi:hypothetical protein
MMDNSVSVYVLTTLFLDSNGDVATRNVGVTFSVHQAEAHRAEGVQNEFDEFQVSANWREDAEASSLVGAMRGFRSLVEEMQRAALR